MDQIGSKVETREFVAKKILNAFRILVAATMLVTFPVAGAPARAQTVETTPNQNRYGDRLESWRDRVVKSVEGILKTRGTPDRPRLKRMLQAYLCAVTSANPSNTSAAHFEQILDLWQNEASGVGLVQGFATKAEENNVSEPQLREIEDLIPGCGVS